jgi:hypothetical protein
MLRERRKSMISSDETSWNLLQSWLTEETQLEISANSNNALVFAGSGVLSWLNELASLQFSIEEHGTLSFKISGRSTASTLQSDERP